MSQSLGITKKSVIGQWLCSHKNTGWFRKKEPFFNLRGNRKYFVCKNCGKVLIERFEEHD